MVWSVFQRAASTLAVAFVIFVLVNLIFSLVYLIKDNFSKTNNPVFRKYGPSAVRTVYRGLSPKELSRLLHETWSRPVVYEPYTQFKEAPYAGKYVNVDRNGFRITKGQGAWPPDRSRYFTVFVFGGSTAFGYGVADDETMASYLYDYFLNAPMGREVKVYNFGRGCYYSTQERILFEKLLTSGAVPDMAVFIDGFNESYGSSGEPEHTARLRQFMSGDWAAHFALMYRSLPMARAIDALRRKIAGLSDGAKGSYYGQSSAADEPMIRTAINGYFNNKKIIEAAAGAYNVKAIFVWQPIPTYKYDMKAHAFWSESFEDPFLRGGYPVMAELVKKNPPGSNFIWSADIQKGVNEPLYVDKFHYSAKMSEMLARHICEECIKRGLLRTTPEKTE